MNAMREPKIGKVLLSAGATGKDLEKSVKLLELVGKMKAQVIKSGPKTRIPAFSVRPDMPLGTRITTRKKESIELLKRLLGAVDNKINKKQVSDNHFSFGIKEYIEIPDMEYIREIGVRGFNVTVVFERKGLRIKNKKIKRGKIPKKQHVKREEIIKYMEDKFGTNFE